MYAITKQLLFFLEFSFTHPAPRGGIKIAGPGVAGFEPANTGVMVPKVRVELTSFLSFKSRKILPLNYSDKSCALPLGDTPILCDNESPTTPQRPIFIYIPHQIRFCQNS